MEADKLWQAELDRVAKVIKRRGDTYADVARALGCSYSQARDWLTNAKQMRAGAYLLLQKKYLAKERGTY